MVLQGISDPVVPFFASSARTLLQGLGESETPELGLPPGEAQKSWPPGLGSIVS